MLKDEGWYVSRCYGARSPPDIFAARDGEFELIMVRGSRNPIRNAREVSLLFEKELDRMRSIGDIRFLRMEAWIRAPPDGWKRYRVYPGRYPADISGRRVGTPLRPRPGESYRTRRNYRRTRGSRNVSGFPPDMQENIPGLSGRLVRMYLAAATGEQACLMPYHRVRHA